LKENGPATATEAIYRDLDYARSLIKRTARDDLLEDIIDDEDATIREYEHRPSSSHSGYSSGSGPGASSEDWSVISDQEDRRSSLGSRRSRSDGPIDRPSTFKRNSLAAAVMSVLPDALHVAPSHRRADSASSSTR
jgi:sterol 3beta-glucosyltransferase